jgi:hypothetical protein
MNAKKSKAGGRRAPLKGGLEVEKGKRAVPKPAVRDIGGGVGVVEIPVHVSDGPVRLATLREDEYIHRARTEDPKPSAMQTWAACAWARGYDLPTIAKSTGLRADVLLKTVGVTETSHPREYQALMSYYDNRRNP